MLHSRMGARVLLASFMFLAGFLPAGRALGASLAAPSRVSVPLQEPTLIALDQHGDSYVVDLGTCGVFNAITELSPSGQVLSRLELPSGSGPGQARVISGIAVDASGDVFISDLLNNRVEEFAHGRFVAIWGDQGRGGGNFTDPEGLAIDRQGNLYVLDANGTRVVKLAADGHVVAAYGVGGSSQELFPLSDLSRGSSLSAFDLLLFTQIVRGLAVDARGTIYVPSGSSGSTVRRISASGTPLTPLTFKGPARTVIQPRQIAVDGQGNLYLTGGLTKLPGTNTSNLQFILGAGVIVKATPSGRILGEWGGSGAAAMNVPNPGGIAANAQGRVAVASTATYSVESLAPDGSVTAVWQNPDNPTILGRRFTLISAVTTGPRGRIYVTAEGRGGSTIAIRSPNGRRIGTILPGEGTAVSEGGAGTIAVGPNGNLYVAEAGASRSSLVQLSPRGVVTHRWKLPKIRDSLLGALPLEPQGVTVDRTGRVYVHAWDGSRDSLYRLDRARGTWTHIRTRQIKRFGDITTDGRGNIYLAAPHRIVVVSPRGRILATRFAPEACAGVPFTPAAVAVGGRGNVFAVDAWPNSQIVKFGPGGRVLARWGHRGFEQGQFAFEYGASLAVDRRGRIYVADGTNRIQVLSSAGHVIAVWHS